MRGGAYSNTPVRIGTWIDGTPIWRLAFDITDISETCDIKIAKSNEGIRIINKVGYTTSNNDDIIDNARVEEFSGDSAGSGWTVNLSAQGTLRIEKIITSGVERVYGWIEYATLESNLPD